MTARRAFIVPAAVLVLAGSALACSGSTQEGGEEGSEIRASPPADAEERLLMPDWDAERSERLAVGGARWRLPEGFRVEEVASNDLVGSVVNMTFDHEGRPLLALEGEGLRILHDDDGDGVFDRARPIGPGIRTAHGLYVEAPGELLVHADGPQAGTGLYRVSGWADDEEGSVALLKLSNGRIQEHGPHTITRGQDGSLYLLYGNHARPAVDPAPTSPLRTLEEDELLPRILDPRGHANSITAPGGTIWRVDLDTDTWELFAGGLRNPFDMAISPDGELFVYEADMEWDRGLPWFRPTRVLHAIAGGDYGWRTGSGKIAFDNPDTLPGVADIGRGSPVGVAFYRHDVYPEAYHGALFAGDWSRGRIRVLFPERSGATWVGEMPDFVLGEPLNVTDLDVGPDGLLYFANGGRQTTGGLYRVLWEGPANTPTEVGSAAERAVRQPMPRSAWAREAIAGTTEDPRSTADELEGIAADGSRSSEERIAALELLQLGSRPPSAGHLSRFSGDAEPRVRATAASLLGTHDPGDAKAPLESLLNDADPLVRRRACESLYRSGALGQPDDDLVRRVVERLGDEDRFVRYAAREALLRSGSSSWTAFLAPSSPPSRQGIEAQLALALSPDPRSRDELFRRLGSLAFSELGDDLLGSHLRTVELALVRDESPAGHDEDYGFFARQALETYPTGIRTIDRKLERLLAHLAPEGAAAKIVATLDEGLSQEEEIHAAYALRALDGVYDDEVGDRFVAWFERARRMRGAASMSGYVEALWQDALKRLPPGRRARAEADLVARRREEAARRAEILSGPIEPGGDDLSQMSIDELAEYLEYDVMSYERYDPDDGESVFQRARCADCHVFGSIGRGGGPDLSTVVSRFRRREILEAIVYPSDVISDQYGAVDLELDNGTTHSGMIVDETGERLTLLTANGERVSIAADEVTSRRASTVSLMPEGLLDALSLRDLVNLIRFLETGSDL